MLNRVHAKGTGEGNRITRADGVDISVGAALTARLAAEVVLEDLLTLGGHVASSVLADVASADLLTVHLEPVERVVSAHSGGKSDNGSGGLHFEGICSEMVGSMEMCVKGSGIKLRSTKMDNE